MEQTRFLPFRFFPEGEITARRQPPPPRERTPAASSANGSRREPAYSRYRTTRSSRGCRTRRRGWRYSVRRECRRPTSKAPSPPPPEMARMLTVSPSLNRPLRSSCRMDSTTSFWNTGLKQAVQALDFHQDCAERPRPFTAGRDRRGRDSVPFLGFLASVCLSWVVLRFPI
jgi:hypothetical protein